MGYNINDIDKILGFKTWTEKQKIDALLKIDCLMYTQLGTDSLKKERDEVHRNSRKIYQAIKTVNPQEAKVLLK